MAKGYIDAANGNRRKIAVGLDEEDFNYINAEAIDEAAAAPYSRKPNFASVLRRLVKLGIEAEKAARPVLKRRVG